MMHAVKSADLKPGMVYVYDDDSTATVTGVRDAPERNQPTWVHVTLDNGDDWISPPNVTHNVQN